MRRLVTGFSLPELVIALALFGIIAAIVYPVISGQRRVYGSAAERIDTRHSLRAAVHILATDFRELDASDGDIAAMSPAEREAFIGSMVERLATRLKDNGHDLDGWMRLARAYKVLGRDDEARGALHSARTNFAGDQAALAEIDKSEQSLGLKGEEPQSPQ